MIHIGSIQEIHERLVSEGANISTCAIRRWVKEGRVPVLYVGSKALISYDRVRALLDEIFVA